jgi:hypothetical protein
MSSRVPPILQGSPKGWFVTMHLPDEVQQFVLLLISQPYIPGLFSNQYSSVIFNFNFFSAAIGRN